MIENTVMAIGAVILGLGITFRHGIRHAWDTRIELRRHAITEHEATARHGYDLWYQHQQATMLDPTRRRNGHDTPTG